jgi:YidC/Oxa1 family membrane protein insertase
MDNARVIAPIVFAGSIILLADAWMKANQPPSREGASTADAPPAVLDGTVPQVTLEADSVSDTPAVSAPSQAAAPARAVTVRTDLYEAKISTQGGVMQTLELLEHYSKDDPDTNLKLFDKNGERT